MPVQSMATEDSDTDAGSTHEVECLQEIRPGHFSFTVEGTSDKGSEELLDFKRRRIRVTESASACLLADKYEPHLVRITQKFVVVFASCLGVAEKNVPLAHIFKVAHRKYGYRKCRAGAVVALLKPPLVSILRSKHFKSILGVHRTIKLGKMYGDEYVVHSYRIGAGLDQELYPWGAHDALYAHCTDSCDLIYPETGLVFGFEETNHACLSHRATLPGRTPGQRRTL